MTSPKSKYVCCTCFHYLHINNVNVFVKVNCNTALFTNLENKVILRFEASV